MTAAQVRLIETHAHLVNLTARRYHRRLPAWVSWDDLCGAARLGLCRAAVKYEPGRGTKFRTYAIQLIRGAIAEELRTADHLPRSLRAAINAGQVPRPCDLTPLWLDKPQAWGDDDCGTLGDQVPAPEVLPDLGEHAELLRALDRLPARERRVLTEYYWQERSMRAIGADLGERGVTESRAFQLRDQALARLRLALC